MKDFGFSKDHRFQDIQIIVGLVVNRDGFPLYFDVFNGKTFEGKTFISVVMKVKTLLENPDLVVIADAAMISRINIEELDKRNIGFIVGARLANVPVKLQEQISQNVLGQDLKTTAVSYLNHRSSASIQLPEPLKTDPIGRNRLRRLGRLFLLLLRFPVVFVLFKP